MPPSSLSQAELQTLLQGLDRREPGRLVSAADMGALSERLNRLRQLTGGSAAHPDTMLTPKQRRLRHVQALHERCVPAVAATFTELLRAPTSVTLTRAEQCGFAEFLLGCESPTCFVLLEAEGGAGGFAIELGLPILRPMLSRLLGGELEAGASPRRPLTDIEKRLALRVVDVLRRAWQAAWEEIHALRLTVLRVEGEGQAWEALTSQDAIIRLEFQIAMGQASGAAHLILPWGFVAGLDVPAWRDDLLGETGALAAADGTVRLAVNLAEVEVPRSELDGLQVGDLIATDQGVEQPLVVTLNGEPRFHAQPGAVDGRKAIRLE
jgi:flagellar motor switch protein FliM